MNIKRWIYLQFGNRNLCVYSSKLRKLLIVQLSSDCPSFILFISSLVWLHFDPFTNKRLPWWPHLTLTARVFHFAFFCCYLGQWLSFTLIFLAFLTLFALCLSVLCVSVCVLYLAQIITFDKSPKYSCPLFLAPMVIWGSWYSSIFLLIYVVRSISCFWYCLF